MKKLLIITTAILLFLSVNSMERTLEQSLGHGLRYQIDEEKNRFVKVGFGLQAWARYMEFNPGTLDHNGDPINSGYDMSLRRTMISMSGMFDRFTFFALLSMDSQTPEVLVGPFASKKPQFFFYDAWTSYDIIENHLSFGFGLNMFNGTSRYASASSSRTLGVDPIVIGVPNLITTEQLARQMSFFLSGQYGIFDFRLALAQPFEADTRFMYNPHHVGYQTFEAPNSNLAVKGYFTLQLWDKESYKIPFKSSSYLGNAKVLNIGFGFDYHPKSTVSYLKDIQKTNDKLHLGFDVFYDSPIGELGALSVYLGAFYFDYGPNYILSYGVMNPFAGALNQYQQGTGTALHLESGYVLPVRIKDDHKIQPFIQFTYRNFEAMPDPDIHYNAGLNYYFADHFLKATLQWEYRPVWSPVFKKYEYFNMLIFKTQLFF